MNQKKTLENNEEDDDMNVGEKIGIPLIAVGGSAVIGVVLYCFVKYVLLGDLFNIEGKILSSGIILIASGLIIQNYIGDD